MTCKTRRQSRYAALLALTVLMAMLCGHTFADDKPLNVLFLSIDDLRPELGCYGVERAHSPAIDELAARGLVFDRAFCQVAQCNQSRTSMLTGLRPDTTGVHDLTTDFRNTVPDAVTMPQWFRKHGYHAQSYGKIFHDNDRESWSVPHGFPDRGPNLESMIGPNPGELKRWLREEAAKAGVTLPEPTDHWKPTPAYGPLDNQLEPTLTDAIIARHGVELLGEMSKRDMPWFLAIGFIKPHMPFVTPQRYWDLYDRDALEIVNSGPPHNAPPVALHQWPELRGNNYGLPPQGPMPDHLARNMTHAYLASVSFVDAQVARVLAELDRLGLRDSTIIVLWGDHGWQLGDHGCWSKHTVFESATRSPLIIATPDGKAAGRHTRSIVEFTDLYPTLCELAGLPAPEGLDGVSFTHLLDNPDAPARDAALSQWDRDGFRGYAIRTDRYRYVEWSADLGKGPVKFRELYDHETDPNETNNIVNDADPKLLAELSERLTKLVSATGDAADIPEEMTDPSDRATFQWLLERVNAEPEAHYKNDKLEWVGFKGESRYTCGLFFDEQGRVVKAMFNKQAIDNEEMKKLSGFKHLQHINCQHNFGRDKGGPGRPRRGKKNILSGEGWIAFKDHPLEYMRLAGSPFDGDGLRAVAQIKALKTLNVFHTAVTDDDMVALRGHPNLEEVVVGPMWDNKITNKTLEHIAQIPNIKRFKVVETYMSYDGGLEHLARLGDQIEAIDLGNTVVPPSDLERLRKELPHAKIEHDPIPEVGQLIIDNWKGADRKLRKWAPAEVIDAYVAEAKGAAK